MVSVIVPVYNSEKTLSACVQSILNQTYLDYEIILIDDGSKDYSGQICDEWGSICEERKVRCQVIHQENGGVSRARNRGIEQAKGEYFVCVDSDDIIESCYLEDLIKTAKNHLELGHVLCGFKCTSHVHDYIYTSREPITVVDRRDYMRLYDKILVQGPCLALYKTEIVRRNGIRMREDLSLGEDLLFNLAYLDALGDVKIGVINKTNYIYQNSNQDSLFRRYRPDLMEIHELMIREINAYLEKWGVEDLASWRHFYRAVFSKYISVLENTFSEANPSKKRRKIRYNNMVLQKQDFQQALEKGELHLPTSYRLAYRSGRYRYVLLAKTIEKLKISGRKLLGKG